MLLPPVLGAVLAMSRTLGQTGQWVAGTLWEPHCQVILAQGLRKNSRPGERVQRGGLVP